MKVFKPGIGYEVTTANLEAMLNILLKSAFKPIEKTEITAMQIKPSINITMINIGIKSYEVFISAVEEKIYITAGYMDDFLNTLATFDVDANIKEIANYLVSLQDSLYWYYYDYKCELIPYIYNCKKIPFCALP